MTTFNCKGPGSYVIHLVSTEIKNIKLTSLIIRLFHQDNRTLQMILLLQQEISHGLQLQHMMVLVLWYFYQVPQISIAQTVDKQYICISYEEKTPTWYYKILYRYHQQFQIKNQFQCWLFSSFCIKKVHNAQQQYLCQKALAFISTLKLIGISQSNKLKKISP